MKLILKWVIGVFLLLVSVMTLSNPFLPFSFICFLVAGIVCTPPLLELLQNKLKTQIPSQAKYLIVFLLSLIGFYNIGVNSPDVPKTDVAIKSSSQATELLKSNTENASNLESIFSNPARLRDKINEGIYLQNKMGDWKNPDGYEWYSLTKYIMIGSPYNGIETENTKSISITSSTEDKVERLSVYSYIRKKYSEQDSFESWSKTTDEVCKLLNLNLPKEFYTKKSKKANYIFTRNGFEFKLENLIHVDKKVILMLLK